MLPASDGWEPLHPLSPLLRAARIGWVLVFFALQALAEGTALPAQLVAGGVVVTVSVAAAYSYVAWRMTGYRVRGQDLELRTGVLIRSHRNVPLARLEAVDIRRPLVPRIFGLAEVRVEVVSQGDSEVTLQYLGDGDALAVRERLAALARGAAAGVAPGEDGTAGEAARPVVRALLQVPAREIVLGYAVGPMAATLALVSLPLIAASGFGGSDESPEGGVVRALTVVAVVFVTTAVPFAARVDKLLNFRLGESDDALHVERGLLNQLTQRVNLGRVQAIRVDEPALWRLFGRARLLVDVAGYRGGSREQDTETAVLLPIAPPAVVRHLLDRLPDGVDVEDVAFVPAPRRARWRSPVRWKYHQVALTDQHAIVRSGWLRRRTDIVPHAKLQSVRVTEGPWQRRLGLATLHLDTAGSRIKARAHHRDAAEAVALASGARGVTPEVVARSLL